MNLVSFSRKIAKQVLSVFASLVVMLSLFLGLYAAPANAGIDPYIGEIIAVPFSYCPDGWAEANGQTVSVYQNQALYSLLGTTFGGDGQNTFGLPDLRGRVPLGYGNGIGLTSHQLGEKGGKEVVAITSSATAASTTGISSSNVVSAVVPNVSTLQPYLTLRYCIATQGIYPVRP